MKGEQTVVTFYFHVWGRTEREVHISNTTTVTAPVHFVSLTCYRICTISPNCCWPQPPTGVSVDTLGDESVDVSWDVQQSMQCDVVIESYSMRYQLRNASTAGYTSYIYCVLYVCRVHQWDPCCTARIRTWNKLQSVSCIHHFKWRDECFTLT